MHDRLKQPNYIFTSYLALSTIIVSHKSSIVTLLGVYGKMLNGNILTIEVECNFETLNDLLTAAGAQAENAIDQLSKVLLDKSKECHAIDVSQDGGIHFEDHIFALQAIYEEGPLGETVVPREFSYLLNGYIQRPTFIHDFIGYIIPKNKVQLSRYYAKLLAMQYELYLGFRKRTTKEFALIFSNLSDPVIYTTAKNHYELKEMQK